MTYHVTESEGLRDLKEDLQRLSDAGHTIVQVIPANGKFAIISTTA
jgi:hypothetical protein